MARCWCHSHHSVVLLEAFLREVRRIHSLYKIVKIIEDARSENTPIKTNIGISTPDIPDGSLQKLYIEIASREGLEKAFKEIMLIARTKSSLKLLGLEPINKVDNEVELGGDQN
ncbi:MAG: hypothetical protein QXR14_06995 [Sulfolobales archaeon]